ncbi:hypothetical protein [Vibrio coralliilyticus]|uniref:hypothetical protein n=1 Tax=Vibrio coralliilyticus TaxID=190893 RepID=UPI0006CDC106|nr:hypothetical protein [Vibrio coralliilyticus]AXN32283.1 hypothetical protein DVV14_13820 [Vibrio coralliilyticus]KPH26195.1 hypothetical protein ADU60_13430 [Vibrio coralliilyticus]
MSNLTLQPKEIRQHSVGNDRFLIVRSATRYIWVVSDGGERIRVEGGDRLDISPFKKISVENPHHIAVTVEYQFTRRDLKPSGAATSTNETKAPQEFATAPHITIARGEKELLVPANGSRVEVLIQNISQVEGEAMIGDVNVAPDVGLPVMGNRRNPAGLTINGSGDLWAYNNSETPVTLAVMEVRQ